MKVALTNPITVGDKTIDEIDLKFDGITGKDILFCSREAAAMKGESVRVVVTDQELHVQVAAKASGLSVETLLDLPAQDYTEVVTIVQSFLTRSI